MVWWRYKKVFKQKMNYFMAKRVSIIVTVCFIPIICCISSADLDWNRSVKTILPSYYNVSIANVLRCGKLCERQGKCAAVTFDVRERKCYMHDIPISAHQTEGTVGRFIIKNYPEGSKPDASASKCDRETQISVPTMHHKYGGCYNITDRNECKPSPCRNNATCEDRNNDHYCRCLVGYTGKNCSVATCPREKGYKLWSYPDMNLCIRYSLIDVSEQQFAQNQCKADDGHLVLIENDSMRLHLVTIASSLGVSTTGRTYLDGKDIYRVDAFIDWKGEKAWLSWAPSNTFGSSEDCLSTRLDDEFRHWDYTCSNKCDYLLCQIDV